MIKQDKVGFKDTGEKSYVGIYEQNQIWNKEIPLS